MTCAEPVFKTLSRSNAVLRAHVDLGRGQSFASWSNSDDRVCYENTAQHTISLYAEGGQHCRRLDGGGPTGAPGRICLMPQASHSEWEIRAPFRFLHIYFPDAVLRHFAAEVLDKDSGAAALPELTYHADPALRALVERIGQAAQQNAPLLAREGLSELYHHLLTAYGPARPAQWRGGLSPALSQRVTDYLRETLGQPVRLGDLAALAGLSEFHFQRMFRRSHGISPHAYLERLRIERAEALIRTGEPLARIAAACGYSSQSHFTRSFHKATGLTPARFARISGMEAP